MKRKREVIVSNKIQCLACSEVIESTSRYSFQWCGCGLIGVDGGMLYLRRIGGPGAYKELSKTYQETYESLCG